MSWFLKTLKNPCHALLSFNDFSARRLLTIFPFMLSRCSLFLLVLPKMEIWEKPSLFSTPIQTRM